MKRRLHEKIARWVVIFLAVVIPSPLVLLYGLAGVAFGFGAIMPARIPIQDRALAALFCFWGLAGFYGFASIWYALAAESLRPVKKWLVWGIASALLSFGSFITLWIFGDLASAAASGRPLTMLAFWPALLVGPMIVSLCYFVCLPRFLREEAEPNHSTEPLSPSLGSSS